jgi:hypothetical protein
VHKILQIIQTEAVPLMTKKDSHKLANLAEAASLLNVQSESFWVDIEKKLTEL